MKHLIRKGKVVPVDDQDEFLSLAQFLSLEDKRNSGVRLEPDEEVEVLADHLKSIPVIALHFPAFSDGRHYSSAGILRHRFNYKGEIRAIGDVRMDQLEQMARCGFDAFELGEGQDIERAIGSLGGFSYSYQHTVDRDPLFRQRGGPFE